MPTLTSEMLARFPRLQVVFHAAGTVRSIVTDASWDRGIRITSAAGENAKPTAEFAFAEIILSLKRAWPRIFAFREGLTYPRNDPLLQGAFGATVGLLSLGKIGRLVAQRLATLDVQVIAYDPTVTTEDAVALNVQLCPLEDIFARADVVSCHMPLTPQTQGTLRRDLFASMKRGATFINTARGALLNEAELADVLRQRPDLYAVLDVLEHEPPRPECPLLHLQNVVLTPHIAGSLGHECRRLGQMMVDEIERYVAGRPLVGEVLEHQIEILA
jgi:phosphoglycerate dehydrogenase-like enzyme